MPEGLDLEFFVERLGRLAEQLVAGDAATPPPPAGDAASASEEPAALRLAQRFELSSFELDALCLAVGAVVDDGLRRLVRKQGGLRHGYAGVEFVAGPADAVFARAARAARGARSRRGARARRARQKASPRTP